MAAQVILGVNNGFAAKNWPEPRQWARLINKELGLQTVQFSFDLLEPTLPEPGRSALCAEILQAAQEYGLTIHSTFTGLIIYAQNQLAHPHPLVRNQAFEWFEAALEVTQKLGGEATGGHIGAMSVADYNDPQRRRFIRQSLVEAVQRLASLAARLGQGYFLWEAMPIPREIPHTPEEAIELMQEVNQDAAVPVYLCFDLGHCNSFDFDRPGDPHQWLERLLPWVRVVHLQQTDGMADHHWPFTDEYNRVGIIQPQRVVEIVKSSPFPEVPMFFELGHAFDVHERQIIEDHQRSVEHWSKFL